MKSTANPKDLRQLSVGESMNTYGGNTQPDLIQVPVWVGNYLGIRMAPHVIDLYMKTSLFLNF